MGKLRKNYSKSFQPVQDRFTAEQENCKVGFLTGETGFAGKVMTIIFPVFRYLDDHVIPVKKIKNFRILNLAVLLKILVPVIFNSSSQDECQINVVLTLFLANSYKQ